MAQVALAHTSVVQQVSLRSIVAIDHVSMLVVLRESGFGLRVDGGRAIPCGCVQGDDAASVSRLFVVIFFDLSLCLSTMAPVDEEEGDEDNEDKYDNTNASDNVLP